MGELHTAFATPSTAVATHPYYGLDGLRYDIAVIRIDTSSLPFAPTPIAHLAAGIVSSVHLPSHLSPVTGAGACRQVLVQLCA